jgi:hypothetical protein
MAMIGCLTPHRRFAGMPQNVIDALLEQVVEFQRKSGRTNRDASRFGPDRPVRHPVKAS